MLRSNFSLVKIALVLCVIALLAGRVSAESAPKIICEGVLANSGEAGKTLVRFGEKKSARDPSGMGVVFDRFGTLWDRGGIGTLNRYALDGRLIASYRLPTIFASSDHLSILGDTLVLQIKEKIYALDITQPAGSSVRDLKRGMKIISSNAYKGRLAGVDDQQNLVWFDAQPTAPQVILALTFKQIRSLEVVPDGSIIFYADDKVQKVVDGKIINDAQWPRRIHGERENGPAGLQLIDDVWFAHAYHSTIKRYSADFTPAPGVVLGGGSGFVIGHVPSNDELSMAQGMAKINDTLYAASGIGGIMHLLEWKPKAQRMEIVRRIGALSEVPGIALDAKGRISIGLGYWNWTDGPDAPLLDADGPELLSQAAMLDNGMLATPAGRYGGSRPAWLSGPPTEERHSEDRKDFFINGDQSPVGAVATMINKQSQVFLITGKGDGVIIHVGRDGKIGKIIGKFSLAGAGPVKVERWTTLATETPETLLAAGDGQIHKFKIDNNVVSDAGAWMPKGDDATGKFGKTIFITSDAGKLWVSDTTRHRVLCFDLTSGARLGQFGALDATGDDLAHLASPTAIASCGNRAVVFDSGNQRLVKLSLP